jgi:hypothetical protein
MNNLPSIILASLAVHPMDDRPNQLFLELEEEKLPHEPQQRLILSI